MVLERILRSLGYVRARRGAPPQVRGRYDAAQTDNHNRRHWAAADGLSAIAANSPHVRALLRNRSRYEVANNGYFDGIGTTLSNDCIGTGVHLQIKSGSPSDDEQLELAWTDWATAAKLPEKLWTMRRAKFEDGEAFGLLIDNPGLRAPVTLDMRLVEADQIASPQLMLEDQRNVDGIVLDEYGNVIAYHVLKTHPGDPFATFGRDDFDVVAAKNVLHYFRAVRPGQRRGVPEIASTLGLGADGRRYRNAVVMAAETAANQSMVIQSDAAAPSAQEDEEEEFVPLAAFELEKNQVTTLPKGWKLSQAEAVQPTTTFQMFKREQIAEMARPVCMPFNIAAADSSGYNYASGRLDDQVYRRSTRVERGLFVSSVLEPLFRAFFREAVLREGLLPQRLRLRSTRVKTTWLFDGHEHVDPVKESSAQATRLENHTTTLAREYGQQGLDWEEELEQRKREIDRLRELGLPLPNQAAKQPASQTADDEEPARR